MTVEELKEKLDKLCNDNLGSMRIAFKHYGTLLPLEEKEIVSVSINNGKVIIE